MSQCPICKEYMISTRHKCNPEWEVVFGADCNVDWGITLVRGYDEEDAVEKAAEISDSDSGEYTIVKNRQETAWVRALGTTEWKKFLVYGETVPEYTAYKDGDYNGGSNG